jgi:glycosyltransferase involved in cell wall biosynthesis
VRRQLGIASEDVVVMMLSTLRPEKGHSVGIAAIEQLRDRHRGLRLLIVGEGPARLDVERASARLGTAARMMGYRDDVMSLLDAADILLAPSLVDALPTALLEGMAASVPVVATAVGGIPEIVEAGVTGLLVDPPPEASAFAAAIELLLCDAEMRWRLGRQGRERFERRFRGGPWIERVRGVYDEVLAR